MSIEGPRDDRRRAINVARSRLQNGARRLGVKITTGVHGTGVIARVVDYAENYVKMEIEINRLGLYKERGDNATSQQ